MIPVAANIPLTLCSVIIRRIIDSYTGHLVPVPAIINPVPTATAVVLFSGALVYRYRQLRRGTLVNIGIGKKISSMIRSSTHSIQRRVKNGSWLFRNLDSCRRKCAEAVLKISQSSSESFVPVTAETRTLQAKTVSGTSSLPIFTRKKESRRIASPGKTNIHKLYSNESFDSNNYSDQDIKNAEKRNGEIRRIVPNSLPLPHRPVTRNFQRSLGIQEGCGDYRRIPPRKKKKMLEPLLEDCEDVVIIDDDPPSSREKSTSMSIGSLRSLRSSSDKSVSARSEKSSKRLADRLKRQHKVQKITRKTRSGKIYAYNL